MRISHLLTALFLVAVLTSGIACQKKQDAVPAAATETEGAQPAAPAPAGEAPAQPAQ